MRSVVLVAILVSGCSLDLSNSDDSDSDPLVISRVEHKEIPLVTGQTLSLGYPCINAVPLDLEPAIDGLQPDIAAWISELDTGRSFVTPACGRGPTGSCYELVVALEQCVGTPTHLAIITEPSTFEFEAMFYADIAVE